MNEANANDRVSGLDKTGTSRSWVDSFVTRSMGGVFPGISMSVGVLSRIALLFAGLCSLKVVMLFGFRKHLFETYWRVGSPQFDWINVVAFLLFVFLISAGLWKLAGQYENTGVRTVRTINVLVLALGSLFIALSFHEGDKNHLYPLMNGVIGWNDLWPYYSMNFFFRAPFLAAWIAGYAAIYYWLARTGRERLVLRVTAICAGVYILACLRNLLLYRQELIVADVLGLTALLFWRRDGSPLKLLWIALPAVFIGTVYFAFKGYGELLSKPRPECVVLTGSSLIIFAGFTLLALRRGFHAGWSWLLTFAAISFLLLVNVNYPLSPNYRNLMCIGLTIPRYFMGEAGVALVLLLAAIWYRKWRPAGSLLGLDVTIIILITLTLIDLRLAQIMGARLDWDLLSLALGEGPKMMWCMARPYLSIMAVLLAVIVVIYTCGLLGMKRLLREADAASGIERFNLGYALALFVLLGLAGRWTLGSDKALGQTVAELVQSSPLWRNTSSPVMDEKNLLASAHRLGMDEIFNKPSLSAPVENVRDLNVVFILQESSYNKYMSLFGCEEETQPLLSQYKDRMELFPRFFSSFASSIHARFACFAGLYPVEDYKQFTLKRVGVRSLFEVLHEHGYANSIFYSSYFDYTNFRDFLRGRDVDEMYDADTMPDARRERPVSWGVSEDDTLRAMQQQIRKYAAAKQKFFMTYVPAAPHYPYDGMPERFRKFSPQKYKDFTPHFLNETLYMDWVITSILDQLKESGLLDKTLVVITSDHGELLGADKGPIGHGWLLTPELANVPLIIMDPQKPDYSVNETVGSLVDLLPTILDKLGIARPPDQLYQGVSLYSANANADRVIYLNSYRQYAIIQGQSLFFGDRDAKSAGGANKVFSMLNEGARTSFVESETPSDYPYSISDFDTFQENFLQNYSHYSRLLHPVNSTGSSNNSK